MGSDFLSAPWAKRSPSLRKAVEELDRLEGDESKLELYEAKLDEVRVMATMLETAYDLGFRQGVEDGQAQKSGIRRPDAATRAMARRMLAKGDSVDDVARVTKLSVETIESL